MASLDDDQLDEEPGDAVAAEDPDQEQSLVASAAAPDEDAAETDEDLRIGDGALTRPVARPATGIYVPRALMGNPVTRFLAESYIELRKVTWPEPRDAWNMSLVVIGMSLAVAILLGAADLGLNHMVTWVVSHSLPAGSPTPTPTPLGG